MESKKIAFLFPGQGSQVVGMGKDIYENYEEAKNVYKKASEILEIDVEKLCFESDDETLAKTENSQIAIAVTSLAILEVIKKHNIKAEIAVGLSLGEYSALVYSGKLSLEQGLKLLKTRGYCMANYIPNKEYKMAAVMGLDSNTIQNMCENSQKENKFVTISNYNYEDQTVISGEKEAVEEMEVLLKEKGAKKVIGLNTSGPFHTKELETARTEFKKALDEAEFSTNFNIPVIKNLDGKIYNENDDIKTILANHITNPVRFDKAIEIMKEKEINTFIEIGPGKAMTGFVKKGLKDMDIECISVNNLENLKLVIGE